MNEYNDEKIVKDIKEGIDDFEQKINVATPDIAIFREMISQVENNNAKKAKKEAVLFVLIAAITLCVETYAFNQSVLFFIVIQGFACTTFVFGLLKWLISSNRKVKSI
jgi:hypothetical protein